MVAPLGKDILVHDLHLGMVVQSANDACMIVAEGLAGSEEAFVAMMNEEARRIGLKKSTFGNSTGLPNPKQLMTARELALLARHIIRQYPEYYKYFSQKEFKYRRFRFRNRNPLIFKYGADGLKTGHTKEAGYGLVVSAVKNGRRLIGVVSGLKSKRAQRVEGERLLEWGFNGFRDFRLFAPGEIVGHARVVGGSLSYVPLVGDNEKGVVAMLPRFMSSKKAPARIIYDGPLIAPVRKGQKIGFLQVRTRGAVVNRVPLYAASDVKKSGIVWRGLDTLLFHAFGWMF
jgi:D-alanyl-D-alanine carboxypeptidase (penicillin-binding protein 5/6)